MAYAGNYVCHILICGCHNGRDYGVAWILMNRKCLKETVLSHKEQDEPEPVEMKVLVYLN